MSKLEYEKVGDVNCKYPYLYVYIEGKKEPFMEVSINEARELEFTFFAQKENNVLDISDVAEIVEKAKSFLPQALENEDSSEQIFT
ncbi:MAG: hypothetical protein AAAB16_00915 [Pseudomonas sp.]|uniref:hypothetical protein n=1 Tax=Pseudomonas sp. TaxID=306 RepID=UPI0030EFE877